MIAFYNKLCLATHTHTSDLYFSFLGPIGCSEHYDGAWCLRSNPTIFQINQPMFPQTAPFYHSTFTQMWSKRWQLCLCASQAPAVVRSSFSLKMFSCLPSPQTVRLSCGWQLMNASHSPLASLLPIKNHLWQYHIILSSSLNVTPRRCWHLKEADQSTRGLYSWSEWYSAWPGWDGFDCGISGAIFVAQFGPADECTEGIITEFHIKFSGCERIWKCRWGRSLNGMHSHIGLCLWSPSPLWSISNQPQSGIFYATVHVWSSSIAALLVIPFL